MEIEGISFSQLNPIRYRYRGQLVFLLDIGAGRKISCQSAPKSFEPPEGPQYGASTSLLGLLKDLDRPRSLQNRRTKEIATNKVFRHG